MLNKIHEEVFKFLKKNLLLTAYEGPVVDSIKLREKHISSKDYKYVEVLFKCLQAGSMSKPIFDRVIKDIAPEIVEDVKHNLHVIKQGQLSEDQEDELESYLNELPLGAVMVRKKEAFIKADIDTFIFVDADEDDNSAALYDCLTSLELINFLNSKSINNLVKTEAEVEDFLRTLVKERKYVDRWINIVDYVNENRE